MTQIFRVDNPLFGRGLKWQQRLCYLNAMLHFQFGLPRVVFLTAPLAYLLFNLNIIHSSASLIFAYVLPHLVLSLYVNSRMNGRFRYTFWGEIYETVMCFHLVIPTILTLLSPKHGKFNVTDKGGVLDQGFFDFHIVRPHVIVAFLLSIGIVAGIVRATMHDYFGVDPYVIALNVGWAVFSLIILMAAIAVARETKQVRKTIRIEVQIPAIIHYASGISSRTMTSDLSMGGANLDAPDNRHEHDTIEEIDLILKSGTITIPATKISGDEESIRLSFGAMPLARRRELVRVVLARADAWIQPEYKQDNPLTSLGTIIRTVFELFWLTWRDRREKRKSGPDVAAKEDSAV
jgi:cellulose synthase (UDP-forming)